MTPSRNEHTIAAACSVSGRGYWSGRDVRVVIEPARVGTGIQLVRSDLASRPTCKATVDHRSDAELRTILQAGDARFAMVEHLMAALFALEIDNCVVSIDSEELPGLDGSSAAYVDALRTAGLIVQAKQKARIVLRETVRIEEAGRWIEAAPSPDGRGHYEYRLSFDDATPIPPQTFGIPLTPHRFIREVARARTFITEQQANRLREQGVAAHVTNQDLIVMGESGPIENTLRFADEFARHKTLDLIGDIALAGIEIVGRITSFRGGHNLNGRMAKRLNEIAQQQIQENQTSSIWRHAA